jgi:hypothetical protein
MFLSSLKAMGIRCRTPDISADRHDARAWDGNPARNIGLTGTAKPAAAGRASSRRTVLLLHRAASDQSRCPRAPTSKALEPENTAAALTQIKTRSLE